MGYDRGDSFPFDFEPNGITFGSKLKGKPSPDHIPFNLKGNGYIDFSVYCICFRSNNNSIHTLSMYGGVTLSSNITHNFTGCVCYRALLRTHHVLLVSLGWPTIHTLYQLMYSLYRT